MSIVSESWRTKKLGACQLLTALFSWCSGAWEGCNVSGVIQAMGACASSYQKWRWVLQWQVHTHDSRQVCLPPALIWVQRAQSCCPSVAAQFGGSLVKTEMLPLWLHRQAHTHRLLKHQHKLSGHVCTLGSLPSHWTHLESFQVSPLLLVC